MEVPLAVGTGMRCVYLKLFCKWSRNLGKGPAKEIIANGARQTMRSEILMKDIEDMHDT